MIWKFGLFFIFFSKIASYSVTIPYKKSSGINQVNISLGTPSQKFEVPINMDTKYFFVSSNFYQFPKSNSVIVEKNINIAYSKKKDFYGTKLRDRLSLDNVSGVTFFVHNFPFIEISRIEELHCTYGLPFSFKFDDDEYSLISLMKNKSLISKKAFGLKTYDEKSGELILGGIPSFEYKKYHENFCEVDEGRADDEYINWGCKLKYISLSNKKTFDNTLSDYYAYFDVSIHGLLVPEEFLTFLKINLLKKFFDTDKCRYQHMNYRRYINCDINIIQEMGSISFTFDKLEFNFNFSKFFTDFTDTTKDLIIDLNSIKPNTFAFGEFFFRDIFANFDYEEKKIFFYTKEKDKIKSIFPNYVKYISYDLSINLLGLIFLVVVKYHLKK